MKRISCILLTSCIWLLNGAFSLPPHNLAIAQTLNDSDLFYMYKGQRIPLNQRQDALAKLTEGIAVAFKRVGNSRGGTPQPLYLQLQQALQGGTRGADCLVSILESTADYQGLAISDQDATLYNSQLNQGAVPDSVKNQQYFFGYGLVNADAAVKAVQRRR